MIVTKICNVLSAPSAEIVWRRVYKHQEGKIVNCLGEPLHDRATGVYQAFVNRLLVPVMVYRKKNKDGNVTIRCIGSLTIVSWKFPARMETISMNQ